MNGQNGQNGYRMGKFGIKGNTGLGVGGMFHVSAPYDSNGKVFIERGDGWNRVQAEGADPKRIIRCCMCDKPAVSLDHLWPYHSEMNRCVDHFGTPHSEDLDTANAGGHGEPEAIP